MAATLAEVGAEDTDIQTVGNSSETTPVTPTVEKAANWIAWRSNSTDATAPNGSDDSTGLSPPVSPQSVDFVANSSVEDAGNDLGPSSGIAASVSSSSDPDGSNNMPQWKKELIQRRKTNIARTIGANQTGTCPKKATNPSLATSPVISMAKNVCNDSSSNKNSTTNTSHSGVNARTQPDIIQPSGSASSSGHYTPANGSSGQLQQEQPPQLACVVNSSPATLFNGKPKTVGAIGTSNLNSFTGNDGLISTTSSNNNCNGGGTTSGTCLTTSQQQNQQSLFRHSQLQQPDSIVGQQFQLHSRLDVERCSSEPSESCAIATGTSFIKNPTVNKTNNKLSKYKNSSAKPVVNTGANVKSESPNANSGNKKMVAAQELSDGGNDAFDFDPSEELQYGPGIVSKLRCRYLSLALRQSAGKQRPNLDNLRRATSLNNLLDDDDRGSNSSCTADHSSTTPRPDSDLTKSPDEFVATFQKNLKISDKQRSRHVKRGNDSLKRARSVEALLVCDKSWDSETTTSNGNGIVQMRYERIDESKPDISSIGSAADVSIEDKITCARERNSLNEKPPKRLSSFMDDTERPPPDVVKQTLKIFEATANRRGRGLSRNNFSGEVAAKVANYKSIISQEKPPIIYPKPPLSPKKNFRKPANLDIMAAKKINNQQQTVTNNNKKTHPASPISNPPKKFATAEAMMNDANEKQSPPSAVQSPSPPIPSIRTDLTFRHTVKNDSMAIRNSPYDGQSPRTPDIIPRKIFDSSSNNVADSPVTQLAKQIERMIIEAPVSPPNNVQRKSSESDDSLDGESLTKRVSKLALENISKAGTTQLFSFNNKAINKLPLASSTVNGNNSTTTATTAVLADQTQVSTTITSKQVGVIRPLLAEPKLLQKADKLKSTASILAAGVAAAAVPPPDYTSAVDELTAKTRDNLVISNLSQQSSNNTNNFSTNNSSNNSSKIPCLQAVDDQQRPALTSREIEKNLINAKKNEQANLEANETKWQFTKKKSQQQPQPATLNNTMVFNFKDRKEVPDYIENDGLLFKRKRELPKPNESGFVLLGDLSLETSTDPEDDWTMGPPSPCDVEFENANIIIDGKSSIRFKSRDISLRVHFDDTLTSTFEYPSESSQFEEFIDNANAENIGNVVTSEDNGKNPGQKLLGSMSLGSAPLGSYTPMKAQINTSFELGVTRAPALNPSEKASDELLKNNSNSSNGNSSDNETNNTATTTTNNTHNQSNGVNYIMNGGGGCSDDPESLQYLKPATDDLTVVYSEGTQKTDLLY